MFQKFIALFLASFITLQASERPLTVSNSKWENYKEESLKNHHKIPGWCKREKAEKLMNLIRDTRPKTSVEIGVYRGSSTYPIAKALKYIRKGVVYAVDPWDKDESLKFEANEANRECWGNIDYEKTYQKFCRMIKKNKLKSYCKVVRATAEKALAEFRDGSVDFIHIDGNHNEESCTKDVEMSLKKLKKGGYLLFDDANWHQTKKAVDYLKANCTFVEKYSVADECLLFIK